MISKNKKSPASHAYHEAGHAIAAVAQELEIVSVSIIPDKNRGTLEWYSAGRVQLAHPAYGTRGTIVWLAGLAAQKKYAPTSIRRYSGARDMELAKLINGMGDECSFDSDASRMMIQRRWKWLVAETERLVTQKWIAIERVATQLLVTGELTGKQVVDIFNQFDGISWERSVFTGVAQD